MRSPPLALKSRLLSKRSSAGDYDLSIMSVGIKVGYAPSLAVAGASPCSAEMTENYDQHQNVDWKEVGREAYELQLRHGRNAAAYAAKLAEKAARGGMPDAEAFWRAVYATLRPRAFASKA